MYIMLIVSVADRTIVQRSVFLYVVFRKAGSPNASCPVLVKIEWPEEYVLLSMVVAVFFQFQFLNGGVRHHIIELHIYWQKA